MLCRAAIWPTRPEWDMAPVATVGGLSLRNGGAKPSPDRSATHWIARFEDAQTVAVPRAPVVGGERRSVGVLVAALPRRSTDRSIGRVG